MLHLTLSSDTSSTISVSLGLDRAHKEARKSVCTATQDQVSRTCRARRCVVWRRLRAIAHPRAL
ncbi:hypothetical protein CORC01_03631 [Colletotrichum orchidophilum]|uniref:Uncharacterized protein n=1 Tax=Colletotrichum orchidophilum TaxID=1209926 RepID=A0A1G4BI36_9PEZI|nr:uncharacterized protein CORC01_03631 [Colletotrichum orchidophilum]OHF01064.1 hypothetical protein CORC01_03631 [Colletotrichum orchidophilum]